MQKSAPDTLSRNTLEVGKPEAGEHKRAKINDGADRHDQNELTPDEAFWVKCDAETNPAEAIDAGQVTCMIGVAPVKPAEFVIFRLAQFSGGTSLVAEAE